MATYIPDSIFNNAKIQKKMAEIDDKLRAMIVAEDEPARYIFAQIIACDLQLELLQEACLLMTETSKSEITKWKKELIAYEEDEE